MGKYLVIKPTTICPPFDPTQLVYREGEEFELDERKGGVKKYIDELGDVVVKAGSAAAKLYKAAREEAEPEPEEEPKPEAEPEPEEEPKAE